MQPFRACNRLTPVTLHTSYSWTFRKEILLRHLAWLSHRGGLATPPPCKLRTLERWIVDQSILACFSVFLPLIVVTADTQALRVTQLVGWCRYEGLAFRTLSAAPVEILEWRLICTKGFVCCFARNGVVQLLDSSFGDAAVEGRSN